VTVILTLTGAGPTDQITTHLGWGPGPNASPTAVMSWQNNHFQTTLSGAATPDPIDYSVSFGFPDQTTQTFSSPNGYFEPASACQGTVCYAGTAQTCQCHTQGYYTNNMLCSGSQNSKSLSIHSHVVNDMPFLQIGPYFIPHCAISGSNQLARECNAIHYLLQLNGGGPLGNSISQIITAEMNLAWGCALSINYNGAVNVPSIVAACGNQPATTQDLINCYNTWLTASGLFRCPTFPTTVTPCVDNAPALVITPTVCTLGAPTQAQKTFIGSVVAALNSYNAEINFLCVSYPSHPSNVQQVPCGGAP
jgi:hypothetical protein